MRVIAGSANGLEGMEKLSGGVDANCESICSESVQIFRHALAMSWVSWSQAFSGVRYLEPIF